MPATHLFMSVAVEMTVVFGPRTRDFIKDLGRCIVLASGELKAHVILGAETICCHTERQCCSVLGRARSVALVHLLIF